MSFDIFKVAKGQNAENKQFNFTFKELIRDFTSRYLATMMRAQLFYEFLNECDDSLKANGSQSTGCLTVEMKETKNS
jgi:hypothetical protein